MVQVAHYGAGYIAAEPAETLKDELAADHASLLISEEGLCVSQEVFKNDVKHVLGRTDHSIQLVSPLFYEVKAFPCQSGMFGDLFLFCQPAQGLSHGVFANLRRSVAKGEVGLNLPNFEGLFLGATYKCPENHMVQRSLAKGHGFRRKPQ
jgi:hypothetical protein